MPLRDGTGPVGRGPLTGRGLGPCRGSGKLPVCGANGLGRGRGLGNGYGGLSNVKPSNKK